MRQAIALILIGALLLVGTYRPVLADGSGSGSGKQSELVAPNGQLTNTKEAPATGPTTPPKPEGESWWQRLLDSVGNWLSDRWQAIKDWWASLPNWAKGLAVGLVAALAIIAVVVVLVLVGVALPVLAIVAIVGAIVGVIAGGLWYGLTEKGAFSVTKALGWVLAGGVVGAAAFALLWEVAPMAWALLLKADAIVAATAGRIVSSIAVRLTAILSPIGAYLAPRLAPVVAWFNGAVAWVQRISQPVITAIGTRWAAFMERISPITAAISMRLQWFMQVTGMARMLDWVNTFFIRLGVWFQGFVATAPRLILSTLNGVAMAAAQLAFDDHFDLDEMVRAFLVGFGLTYFSMLPGKPNPPATNTAEPTRPKHATTPPLPGEQIQWPPNDGFHGARVKQVLQPGTLIDRYGRSGGSFLSPAETPFEARALPPHYQTSQQYHVYEVVKPLEVEAGLIEPWFGQRGLGTQYLTPVSVQELLDAGILREVLNP